MSSTATAEKIRTCLNITADRKSSGFWRCADKNGVDFALIAELLRQNEIIVYLEAIHSFKHLCCIIYRAAANSMELND